MDVSQITKDDVAAYKTARRKSITGKANASSFIDYSKYSISSWELSGLSIEKYMTIAKMFDEIRMPNGKIGIAKTRRAV